MSGWIPGTFWPLASVLADASLACSHRCYSALHSEPQILQVRLFDVLSERGLQCSAIVLKIRHGQPPKLRAVIPHSQSDSITIMNVGLKFTDVPVAERTALQREALDGCW